MSDNWELEFRKQVALDGHTIETLDNENAQLRARVAELEKQVESMRRCSNCANYIGGTGVCDDDYCGLGIDKEDECFHDNGKHWQQRGNDEG